LIKNQLWEWCGTASLFHIFLDFIYNWFDPPPLNYKATNVESSKEIIDVRGKPTEVVDEEDLLVVIRIEPNDEGKDPKPAKRVERRQALKADTKISWLDDEPGFNVIEDYMDTLVDNVPMTAEENYVSLPQPHTKISSVFILKDINLKFTLLPGDELCGFKEDAHQHSKYENEDEEDSRTQSDKGCIVLDFNKFNLYYMLFKRTDFDENSDEYNYGWRIHCHVHDLVVHDNIVASKWRTFMCYNVHYPRQDNTNIISFTYDTRNDPKGNIAKIRASLLPLRFYIDQYALMSLLRFFPIVFGESKRPRGPKGPDSSPSPPTRFDVVSVKDINVLVDFKPKSIDEKFKKDDNPASQFLDLVLVPFENLALKLSSKTLTQVVGWEQLIDTFKAAWEPEIKPHAVVARLVYGLRPLRPFFDVGQGIRDLVVIPWEEYTKTGSLGLLHGIQMGTSSFFQKLLSGTTELTARALVDTASLLDKTSDIIQKGESPPGLPSKFANTPSSPAEGVVQAIQSVRRGFGEAAHVVTLPLSVFKKEGVSGFLTNTAKAIPLAIIRPTAGVTEGLGRVVLGLRSGMNGNEKADRDKKYGGKKKKSNLKN